MQAEDDGFDKGFVRGKGPARARRKTADQQLQADADESEGEREEATSRSQRRKEKFEAKRDRKKLAKDMKKAEHAASAALGATKKCAECKKTLPLSDFWEDQGRCKQCSKEKKAVIDLARRQGEIEWFKTLDEKGQVDLGKAYKKAKTQAEKDRTKVKFSIKTYRESVVASAGLRGERRRRLMSESQFIAWATSDDGDNLTRQQAASKWEEMKSDPTYKKEGPKGPKQKIYVPIHKELVDFEEISLMLICFVCS
ncbi:unnamed protein product [Symbiodinium sp. CCMP2592]|nr:unnamed protein product [Symbiodinium sp. CCMP2592]